MMTDAEIAKICLEWPNNATKAARGIIAACTAKLLAGVEMPESVGWIAHGTSPDHTVGKTVFNRKKVEDANTRWWTEQEAVYTKDQLQSYAASAALNARRDALDEAIVICRRNAQNTSGDEIEALEGKV